MGPVSRPVFASRKLEFAYDYISRRVRKQVFTHDGTAWGTAQTSDTRFVRDNWNVLMELDGVDHDKNGQPDNTAVCKYTWGLDLSGSLHGAGGTLDRTSPYQGQGGGILSMQASQETSTPGRPLLSRSVGVSVHGNDPLPFGEDV